MMQKNIETDEAKQRRLLDLSLGAVAILRGPSEEFSFEFVNLAYRRLFSGQELLSLPYCSALPASYTADFEKLLGEIFQNGKPLQVNDIPFTILDAQGQREQVYIDFRYEAIKDESGSVTGIFVQGIDTTSAYEAKEGLRKGNERFGAAADAIGVMWTAMPDGNLAGEQAGWARLTGQTQSEYADMGWAQVIHPDDAQLTIAAWKAAAGSKKTFTFEHRIKSSSGKWRTHTVRAVPLLEPDGSVREWVGVHIDITDQREAQEALAELNRTLEQRVAERQAERDTMWQLSEDLLAVLTRDGTIRSVSPSSERILGYTPQQMVDRSIEDFVHADDVSAAVLTLRGMVDKPTKLANRWRTAGGDYRTISWQASSEGETVFASGHDITGELQAAKDLEEAQVSLRQAQKMESVGHLTGGIAHDFNNLLQSIGMSLQLIKRMAKRPDKVEIWIDKAMESVSRGAKLTAQLLAFARLQQLSPQPVHVSAVLDAMAELLSKTVGPTVHFVFDTHHTQDMVVAADATQLEVAIVNLCINARDAMPHGGTVTLSTRQFDLHQKTEGLEPGRYIEILVADTGVGMPAEVREQAFDPFFTTKDVGRGAGLGLSQVYGFAHQLGGLASIESEVGVGTCVRVALRQIDAPSTVSLTAADFSVTVSKGANLLLVDDDLSVLATVQEMLVERGYAVRAFEGAAQCLAAIDGQRPDLLITDYAMPGTNGAELARRVLVAHPSLPIIVATGYADSAELKDAVGIHATILRKPFSIDELIALIERKLASAENWG